MQASALGDDGVQTVRYWLYAPGHRASEWDDFYARGIMGLAWGELGDLRAFASRSDLERQLLQRSSGPGRPTNDVLALWQFANEMKPGDVIFAKRGIKEIIGRGVVTGDYVYDADAEHYRNVRGVRWTHKGNWSLDKPWSVRKTLTEITDYTDRLAQLKAFFEEEDGAFDGAEMSAPLIEYPVEKFLGEVYMDRQRYDAIVGLLRAKKNVIMQGAPGVGKTFAAKRLAYSMMGVKDASRVKLVQFHQSYSYEDFIEGYRPSGAGFELVKGAFYSFCRKAADDEDNDYFFIIDEINRGNLSTVFGELFMLIESDKRGPEYKLRRRFAFVELRPAFDSDGFRDYCAGLDNSRFEALVREVVALNKEIAEDESLGDGFCIGHSYFCNMNADTCTDATLASIVEYELIPMLKEYWFDEPGKVREWADRLRRPLR